MIEQRRVPTAEADLGLVAAGATSHRFLELLAARDFERLVAALASDAHARFRLPGGARCRRRPDAGFRRRRHRLRRRPGSGVPAPDRQGLDRRIAGGRRQRSRRQRGSALFGKAARAADHVHRGARRRAPHHHCGETEMNEKLIFNCTWGREEPERATLPFIAANIAATAGQDAVVLCTIEAVRLGCKGGSEGVEATGLPKLHDLMTEFVANQGKVWLCGACAKPRGITPEQLADGVSIVGAAKIVEEIVAGAKTVAFA